MSPILDIFKTLFKESDSTATVVGERDKQLHLLYYFPDSSYLNSVVHKLGSHLLLES